jgi:predicted metal-binding protein
LKQLAIRSVKKINPATVVTAAWVKDHCRFGCSTYGEKCCPPHSPGYEESQTKIGDYEIALLIEGQPPTGDFQRLMLQAEKTAFKTGYYKAFAYWAGPCSLCAECKKPAPPKKCTVTRPSMESAGIDVFATVRAQGYHLKTLKDKTEFAKYFGLLLLE